MPAMTRGHSHSLGFDDYGLKRGIPMGAVRPCRQRSRTAAGIRDVGRANEIDVSVITITSAEVLCRHTVGCDGAFLAIQGQKS
jgi:hypothetical protein